MRNEPPQPHQTAFGIISRRAVYSRLLNDVNNLFRRNSYLFWSEIVSNLIQEIQARQMNKIKSAIEAISGWVIILLIAYGVLSL